MTRLRLLAPDWRTLFSGALIVFAFPPWDISPLIWVALVPWFAALERTPSARRAAIEGIWLSFFMTVGGFHWVAYVLTEFAGLPWPISILGLLLFALGGQPQFVIFGPIWREFQINSRSRWKSSSIAVALAAAFLYTGIDWYTPKLFMDTLGHSLYEARKLRQIADIGGPILLTYLVFIVNGAVWSLIRGLRRRREPSTWPAIHQAAPQLAVAAAFLAGAFFYGSWRNSQIQRLMSADHRKIQIGVIQANIGDFDKIAAQKGVRGAAAKVLETFFEMSEKALALSPKPEALVWPETSYPSTFRTPNNTEEFARDQNVEKFAHDHGVPLLFGGYDSYAGKDFNAFFYLSAASDLQIYRKNVLLLFGEYIPGAESFHFLKEAFPQVGNFGRGKGPSVLEIPSLRPNIPPVKTGPIICYEALFPNYVIEAARQGSRLILNITNDSWFGRFGEPHLHLALSAFRSIETRLPQLRSTNTGISALILPDGEITHRSAIYAPEILNLTVPLIEPLPTVMMAWGDWFGRFAMAAGILVTLLLQRFRRTD